MRERLARELEFLITVLPLYQKEALVAQQKVMISKDSSNLAEYMRALARAQSKSDLMEFIIRMLEEDAE